MSRPRNDDRDLEVMAAWFYYVHGMGQEQVARKLDISRTKVTRLLARARDTGRVKITLDHELSETLALSDWICKRYGVKNCLLTPPSVLADARGETAEQIGRQGVGIVAANYLTRRVQNDGGMAIGVGGGRTLAQVVGSIRSLSQTGLRTVSLTGTSSQDDGTSACQIARDMAEALGGSASTLPAPLFVGRVETRTALEADPVIREVLDLAAKTTLNLVSCGAIETKNSFCRASRLSAAEICAAERAGACCEVVGIWLTETGEPAKTELNERRVGVSLDSLRESETVIVASGARKIGPLKAAIRAGIARTIIIDHDIAGKLAAG